MMFKNHGPEFSKRPGSLFLDLEYTLKWIVSPYSSEWTLELLRRPS